MIIQTTILDHHADSYFRLLIEAMRYYIRPWGKFGGYRTFRIKEV